MVRFPPGWGKAFHPQRTGYRSSQLAWRPGWRGSGIQPVQAVPVTRYTGKLTSVPLTGGQAQGQIPPLPANGTGTVTSPSSFQLIAQCGPLAAGVYTVAWTVTLSGTLGAADANNFGLNYGPVSGPQVTLAAPSVNAGSAGSYVQAAVSLTVTQPGQFLLVKAWLNTPTTGAVYGATISVTGTANLALQVGPQGLGTVWYPVQATISTTTGALDTSTALVYLGPLQTPATLVGTVYSGNGTVALAIPSMAPGQTLITSWTGAKPGDTAAVNIIGTMDALTTG